ncbi:MAG: decarboxylating 6-phosphogluconate dehydrogenase [Candidatus Pacebacteria bacterium]|nr:decarboxylating 6-phosphogluconate dehydrogenase [Candidatus Paceibacterota bacterium]
MKKELGYIGLGKMGKNMVFRMLDHGWKIVAYNRTQDVVKEVEREGAVPATDLKDLVSKLSTPRTVWVMVSHSAVDEVLNDLLPHLESGDTIIDGGNSPYQETIRRAKEIEAKGIKFMDIGVSGGPGGSLNGACMMVGGNKDKYDELEATGFFKDTCVDHGFGYMGPHGAGHFVKMIHNGIEYGMMQSIAEGYDLLRHSKEYNLDLERVTDVYAHGSVITSRLVSWLQDGIKKYGPDLNDISGRASASGEGKWTVEAGTREGISMPAIQAALDLRKASQETPSYQGKVTSTMRGEFGQHPVKRGEDEPEVL